MRFDPTHNPHHGAFCMVMAFWVLNPMLQNAWAFGLLGPGPSQTTASVTTVESRTALIVDSSDRVQGLLGGISSAYMHNGELRSVFLVVLTSGYVAPRFGNGAVAAFPVAYFNEPGCKGIEYVPASFGPTVLMPFNGLIYRSLASRELKYIPQNAAVAAVPVSSRLTLDRDAGARCEDVNSTLGLYPALLNNSYETGFKDSQQLKPIFIQTRPTNALRRNAPRDAWGADSEQRLPGDRDDGSTDGVTPPDASLIAPECSPGCLVDAVGNQICDIACYVSDCDYDGGDCDSMPEKDLNDALSKMCSPGCFVGDIGDGFCDAACNVPACENDRGDCDSVQTQ